MSLLTRSAYNSANVDSAKALSKIWLMNPISVLAFFLSLILATICSVIFRKLSGVILLSSALRAFCESSSSGSADVVCPTLYAVADLCSAGRSRLDWSLRAPGGARLRSHESPSGPPREFCLEFWRRGGGGGFLRERSFQLSLAPDGSSLFVLKRERESVAASICGGRAEFAALCDRSSSCEYVSFLVPSARKASFFAKTFGDSSTAFSIDSACGAGGAGAEGAGAGATGAGATGAGGAGTGATGAGGAGTGTTGAGGAGTGTTEAGGAGAGTTGAATAATAAVDASTALVELVSDVASTVAAALASPCFFSLPKVEDLSSSSFFVVFEISFRSSASCVFGSSILRILFSRGGGVGFGGMGLAIPLAPVLTPLFIPLTPGEPT